jgi:hypothetical protein
MALHPSACFDVRRRSAAAKRWEIESRDSTPSVIRQRCHCT